jgi:hypothetical protein
LDLVEVARPRHGIASGCFADDVYDDPTTSSGTTGSGGGDASSGAGGDGGSVVACPAIESFTLTIARDGVPLYQDCILPDEVPPEGWTVQGSVMTTAPGSFAIDACANVECDTPEVYDVTVDTRGVPVVIPDGTLVELHFDRHRAEMYICAYSISIRNVDSIAGGANPTEAGQGLWLQGLWGVEAPDAPVRMELGLDKICQPEINGEQGREMIPALFTDAAAG